MKRTIKRFMGIISALIIIPAFIPISEQCTKAVENNFFINGNIYEFDNKSEYDFNAQAPAEKIKIVKQLGKLNFQGSVSKEETIDDIPSYTIEEGQLLTLTYKFNNYNILHSNEDEWHITGDNPKNIGDINVSDKIDKGVLIFQTSFDRQKWVTNSITKNLADTAGNITYQSNDIQLYNGCYYRIIAAYKAEMRTDDPVVGPDKYDRKKYAEVYEFYASYGDHLYDISDDIETYELGNVYSTGTDNGYSKREPISVDDPHSGWKMGTFTIGGFTDNIEDKVFLKNVGDKVTLWYDIKQDIDKLNNNVHLTVNSDENGSDQKLDVPKQYFGKGTLIIRFTDHKGKKHDPIIYTNFLEALASPGVDTRIQLFEEGDYEVALDYEIRNDKWLDKLYSYRNSFEFKIRNSNCMVYPRDIKTSQYLSNTSVTENGFVLDWAMSRYLKINVQLSQWTKGADGKYYEDIKFNQSAKESDEFTDSGIYTITVTNPITDPYGNTPTVKKIYVGSDSVLIASMNEINSSLSINEIAEYVELGATITPDGQIIMPVIEEITEAVSESTTSAVPTTSARTEATKSSTTTYQIATAESNGSGSLFAIIFICIGITGSAVVCFVWYKRYRKNDERDEQ